jgi:RNA polymerase-interacting CarD/CdnL/TRCF family regulator
MEDDKLQNITRTEESKGHLRKASRMEIEEENTNSGEIRDYSMEPANVPQKLSRMDDDSNRPYVDKDILLTVHKVILLNLTLLLLVLLIVMVC